MTDVTGLSRLTSANPAGVLVVVAHPDDEILWLSSVVAQAARILAVLPWEPRAHWLNEPREALLSDYPLESFEYLSLRGAGVFRCSDWSRRRPVEHGVTLKDDCPTEVAATYRENYATLLEMLGPHLSQRDTVYTHNPWGEYGHEEHVQVCNAVMSLAERHGNSVWAWNGFSSRQLLGHGMRLRKDFFERSAQRLPRVHFRNDLSLFHDVKQLYQRHQAWTWDDDYEIGPVSEYIQLVDKGVALVRPSAKPLALQPLRIAVRSRWNRLTRSRRRPLKA